MCMPCFMPHLIGQDYIVFRDILRADATVREEYAQLKLMNAQAFAHDRKGYTSAKEKFVQGVLSRSDLYNA